MCKDPALTYLNGLGYNVVRFPRADLQPLDVLGRQHGVITRLGRIIDLGMHGALALPTIRMGLRAPDIEAQRSSQMDASAGVAVMAPYLRALGGNGGASAQFRRAKSLQLVFTDVLLDEASPADIGSYLELCHIDPHHPLWRPYTQGEGELYIVTETLRSSKLAVSAQVDRQAGATLDASALQAAVGAKVAVRGEAHDGSLIHFDGGDPVVFGFKCLGLRLRGQGLDLIAVAASGAMAFSVGDSAASASAEGVLLGQGLVRVRSQRSGVPLADSRDAPVARQEVDGEEAGEGLLGEEEEGLVEGRVEVGSVQDVGDSASLPEEDSPASAGMNGGASLFVQLCTPQLDPLVRRACRVRGPLQVLGSGYAQGFGDGAIDIMLRTDDEGVVLLEGCPAGAYVLTLDVEQARVHTLHADDLRADRRPYRVCPDATDGREGSAS